MPNRMPVRCRIALGLLLAGAACAGQGKAASSQPRLSDTASTSTPSSSNTSGSALVGSATAKTIATGSAGVDLDFSQTYRGLTRRFTLSGSFDFTRAQGSWSIPVAAPASSSTSTSSIGPKPTAPSTTTVVFQPFVETTMIDSDRYFVSVPSQYLQQAKGKQWLELPLTSYPRYVAANPIGALETGLIDPRTWTAMLRGTTGRAKDQGSISVDGSPATLYQVTANLTRAANHAGPVLAVVDGIINVLQTALVPMSVAIDDQGRVVRAAVSLDVPVPGAGPTGAAATSLPLGSSSTSTTTPGQGSQTLAVDVVVTFSSFGIVVKVTPPPSGEVMNLAASASGG